MSRNHRMRGKVKRDKQQRDARLRLPSKSTIWNQACDRADELIDQNLWSEARDVLETVDRLHPGADCIHVRLAVVYEELGESELLASVRSLYKSNPIVRDLVHRLIDLESQIEEGVHSSDEPDSRGGVLLQFEVYHEPNGSSHSPQVQEWAEAGFEALQNENGRKAEVLFKKCLEAEGDAPDLLNNLAAAYMFQGRDAESEQLAREIYDRWPDYFFGRIAMANLAMQEGRFDDADQYLRTMLTQQRFHITEFHAFVTAHIQLEIKRRRVKSAQNWLDLWKSVEPDHPRLSGLKKQVDALSMVDRLGFLLKRFQR